MPPTYPLVSQKMDIVLTFQIHFLCFIEIFWIDTLAFFGILYNPFEGDII